MPPINAFTRRQALQASAAVAAATAACRTSAAPPLPSTAASLLAPDYAIAAAIPSSAYYVHDPGMVVLPSGNILVAAPIRRRHEAEVPGEGPYPQSTSILLTRSDDRGATWAALPSLPTYRDATPFVHGGAVYLLIPDYAESQILLMRSDDEGQSWSPPTTLFQEPLWNCQTAVAVRGNRLYWAMTSYPGGNSLKALSADLTADLLDPTSWRLSPPCDLPAIPPSLKYAGKTPHDQQWRRSWNADTWLEPNVVNVNDRLRVLVRIVTGNFSTTNLAAVCEIDDRNGALEVSFCQFHALPGGQCKFFIMYDQVSQMFWMLSNIPTDSHDLYDRGQQLVDAGFVAGPGNERRILALHYGVDALNWFPAGIVAMWPSPLQAFMYPSAVIDGDDLAFVSRTSRQAPNQHDADAVTFHRIKNFRALAIDLRPTLNLESERASTDPSP